MQGRSHVPLVLYWDFTSNGFKRFLVWRPYNASSTKASTCGNVHIHDSLIPFPAVCEFISQRCSYLLRLENKPFNTVS